MNSSRVVRTCVSSRCRACCTMTSADSAAVPRLSPSWSRLTFQTPLPPLPRSALTTRVPDAASRAGNSCLRSRRVGYRCVSEPQERCRVVTSTSLVPILSMTRGSADTHTPVPAILASTESSADRGPRPVSGSAQTSTPSVPSTWPTRASGSSSSNTTTTASAAASARASTTGCRRPAVRAGSSLRTTIASLGSLRTGRGVSSGSAMVLMLDRPRPGVEGPVGSSAVVDVEAEPVEPGLCRVPEVLLAEDVLDARQQRVVVVRGAAQAAGPDVGRQGQGADPAAAQPGDAGQGRVGTRALAAAGAGVALRPVGLVEGDEQQAVLGEGGRRQDRRDGRLEPGVRGREAARLAVHAGRVVAVVAQVGGDVRQVARRGARREVGTQLAAVHHVGGAVRRVVDDGVEV